VPGDLAPIPTDHWIFLVDHSGGRLLCARRAQDRADLNEVGRLINESPEPEHHPPSTLSGHGSHAYASLHHEVEERRSRWAKTAAAWLARHADQRGIDRVAVVSPGHLIGALRKAWPVHLAPRISEHEGELCRLTMTELSRHPAMDRLVAT
jgi:hypothetical protein